MATSKRAPKRTVRKTRRPRTGTATDGATIGKIRKESLETFGVREMGIYAEEVNLARAVPNLIDGLKPVQRRIMWAASLLGKDFVKTARVVGDCFPAGTLVTLSNGAQVPIETVVVGDEVMHDDGIDVVTDTFVREDSELYEVTTDQGTVQATPDQIFYCVDANGKEVERTPLTMKPGDQIKTCAPKKLATVTCVRKVSGRHRTYDFEVKNRHRFYANGFLVHNCIGRYHPHGDASVGGAITTMVQANVPALSGKGNWGSLIDPAAAMRYCFVGSTRVNTERGLLSMDELAKMSRVGTSDNIPFRVLVDTKASPANTSHFVNSGIQSIVRVSTKQGYTTECTPNEPFYVITPDGYRWVDASELKADDWLCLKRGTNLEVKGCHSLDLEVARFLGYMVGDGYMNKGQNALGFNQVSNEVFKDFVASAKVALPSYAPKARISKQSPRGYGTKVYNQWSLFSVPARHALKKLGLVEGSSYDQRVPKVVFRGNTAFVVAFLQALYEADGSVTGKPGQGSSSQVVLHSVSRQLLDEVSLILRSQFGIFGAICADGRAGLRLVVSGAENVSRFRDQIGFRSKAKSKCILVNQDALTGKSSAGTTNDCVPYARELGLGRDSRTRVAKLRSAVAAGTVKSKAAQLIVERDYYYAQVASVVDAGEAQVWDLTVPGTHSFVANGFVVHNTNCTLSNYGWTFFDPDYINKTVTSFVPNYDDSTVEPVSLPALLPNILLNGGEGIGVGTTTVLPTFTPDSVSALMLRILKGEKLTALDFAKTLKYANRYGGRLVRTAENKRAWMALFTQSTSSVQFEANLIVDRDNKAIEIDDWPQGLNPVKFINKIRAFPEVDQAYNHKGATGFRIEVNRNFNYAQFDKLVAKVQKATQVRRAFKINVTHRKSEVVDGVVKYDTEYLSLSVCQLMMTWLRARLDLEKRSLNYRIEKQNGLIAYSKLLIYASNNLEVIFKALRQKDSKAYLMTHLKLSAQEADQILDLKVRQLSKLDQDAIKAKLQDQKAHLSQLKIWLVKPRMKVAQDIDIAMKAIHKDIQFELAKDRKMGVS